MKVIPVIDILNRKVVHAVGGLRNKYKLIKSVLSKSADPVDVALKFKLLGLNHIYIADLDSIVHKKPNFDIYKKIKSVTNSELIIDAGINNLEIANKVLRSGASKIIIGTETLKSLKFVEELAKIYSSEKIIVSIDMMNGKLLSSSEGIKSMNPISLIKKIQKMGVKEIILLELTRVGSERGVDTSFLRKITGNMDILIGGGVRDIKDIKELEKMGVKGVLIATSLHKGAITKKDLDKI